MEFDPTNPTQVAAFEETLKGDERALFTAISFAPSISDILDHDEDIVVSNPQVLYAINTTLIYELLDRSKRVRRMQGRRRTVARRALQASQSRFFDFLLRHRKTHEDFVVHAIAALVCVCRYPDPFRGVPDATILAIRAIYDKRQDNFVEMLQKELAPTYTVISRKFAAFKEAA